MSNKAVVTHEPDSPRPNWPESHVNVTNVFYDSCSECVKITIHDCDHYLHNTTALALYTMLQEYFKDLPLFSKMLMMQNGCKMGEELLRSN